jgi:hypothetical protein
LVVVAPRHHKGAHAIHGVPLDRLRLTDRFFLSRE